MSLRFSREGVMFMESYQELMREIERAAVLIFDTANTEGEVCELEQVIYGAVSNASQRRIEELSARGAEVPKS